MTRARDLAAFVSNADGDIKFDTDTLFIDSSANRVGISNDTPARNLSVNSGSSSGYIQLANTNSGTGASNGFEIKLDSAGSLVDLINRENGDMRFFTNNTERMRIDSSGNLLLGTTSSQSGISKAAFEFDSGAEYCLELKDSGSGTTGTYGIFYRGSTSVGSLLSIGGTDLAIAGNRGTTGAGIRFTDAELFPITKAGATNDNFVDVGHTAARYDDIYATNGTIQTSDEREKQQIASLTDAEITAAKAISKLFKTFKWNDKVEAKGDAARTHAGVIAQQVETAMSDAGLDAGNYAFFISTTWWETQTEVAAVEADEENGIEAQDAYTRTDTYNTQEEAPEGATERNRKGIRYPELLSFIGAATEQRLTSIEARLDALEAE